MTSALATVAYIGATILSSSAWAASRTRDDLPRRGNLYGIIGMRHRRAGHRVRPAVGAGAGIRLDHRRAWVVGGGIGLYAARRCR